MTIRQTFLSKGFSLALFVSLASTTPALAGSVEFGRCLTRNGATFYGTSWCPQCRAQRKLLGRAMSQVRYVECSVGSNHDRQASACNRAGIDGYPTWVFADGSHVSGRLSLESLAARTGCMLSNKGKPQNDERVDDNGNRRRNVGGALIIDIPQ